LTDCIFCQIANARKSAAIVYEDDSIVAFLDVSPIRVGHTQIVPRVHYPYFEDLPYETAANVLALGQRLARGMKALYHVPRVAFLFTGGDVAHAHAHIVPMHEATDITSRRYILEDALTFRSLPLASTDDLLKTADRLRTAMQNS
jgi:histidine triad (HIT) family protein